MSWITCSLDIGNGYVKWVLFLEEYDKKTTIIAKDMVKSKWLKRWKILDSNSLSESLLIILENLSKKVDSPIDEVIVWISHPDMKVEQATNHKRLTNIEITNSEVSSLLEQVTEYIDEMNYEILKVIPSKWVIDDNNVVKNPIWMQWRKLELFANIFMIPSIFYKELDNIFSKLEIDVIDYVPNILWSEEWVIDSETKDLWWVLIDIWTNQTSYIIYEDGVNIWYGIIPIWWEEITKDISIWLKIDYNQADQIKKEEWEILLNQEDIDKENSKVDKLFLSDIIEARLSEDIYKPILEKMEKLWVAWKLPWWVILIWWSSKIKNIDEFTRNYFGLSCKHWKIVNWSFGELWMNVQFINSIWDYIWEWKYWEDGSSFNFSFNISFLKNIVEWFKKIF